MSSDNDLLQLAFSFGQVVTGRYRFSSCNTPILIFTFIYRKSKGAIFVKRHMLISHKGSTTHAGIKIRLSFADGEKTLFF